MDTTLPMLLGTSNDKPVTLPPMALLKHVVVLGDTGSGKTVATKTILEEAVRSGIPVIAIDIQGDISAVGKRGDDETMFAKGVLDLADDYFDKLDLKIWTPASSVGIPLSLVPALESTSSLEKYEDQLRSWTATAQSVATLIGYKGADDAFVAACVNIFEYAYGEELALETMQDLIAFFDDPPMPLMRELDKVFPEKAREQAVRKIRTKLAGPSRLLFSLGKPIDIEALLGYDQPNDGKVRVSVIYLNGLNTIEEQQAFIAALCNSLFTWMLQNPSPTPQALLYIDECAPFLPAGMSKPVCKVPISRLLRQGRKFGVSLLLATQSPGDLDYALMGQIGTWLVGRLKMKQQVDKIAKVISGMAGDQAQSILASLTSMPTGRFVMASPDTYPKPVTFDNRWLSSSHETLTSDAIEDMVSSSDREVYGGLDVVE